MLSTKLTCDEMSDFSWLHAFFYFQLFFFYPPRTWKVVDPNGILLCWKKKDVAIVKARRRDLLTKYKELL